MGANPSVMAAGIARMNLQSNYDLAIAESGVWNTVKKFIPEFNIRAACL